MAGYADHFLDTCYHSVMGRFCDQNGYKASSSCHFDVQHCYFQLLSQVPGLSAAKVQEPR